MPLVPVAGRAFSTSLARPESDFKRDRRMYRKKVDMLHKQAQEDWYNTQPDPFLGMQLVVSRGERRMLSLVEGGRRQKKTIRARRCKDGAR